MENGTLVAYLWNESPSGGKGKNLEEKDWTFAECVDWGQREAYTK